MLATIHLELRKKIEDKGLLFWTFILPIIFTVLFIAVFTSGTEAIDKQQIIISIVPGYIVMFVFFVIISMVDTLHQDLKTGMTARLASTPLTPNAYLLGKWIPYMYIVLIQIATLFLFGKIVYDIPLMQPIFIVALSILLTFTVTGMGIAIAIIVKSFNMGLAITQLITLVGALLSGLWIPIDMLPSYIQTVSKIFPQYWAHQAFQGAMAGDLTNLQLVHTLTILFGFGLIGFVIALIRYPTFLRRAKSL